MRYAERQIRLENFSARLTLSLAHQIEQHWKSKSQYCVPTTILDASIPPCASVSYLTMCKLFSSKYLTERQPANDKT